jgi:hypothetical protein
MMSALSLKYEKIDVCPDNCMLFWKEHANDKKCLECGKSRFIEVVTEDGEKVTTEVTQKLDRFDTDFASDVRNICFGLATDGFDAFSTNSTPYSY